MAAPTEYFFWTCLNSTRVAIAYLSARALAAAAFFFFGVFRRHFVAVGQGPLRISTSVPSLMPVSTSFLSNLSPFFHVDHVLFSSVKMATSGTVTTCGALAMLN